MRSVRFAVAVAALVLGLTGCRIGTGFVNGADYCYLSIGTDWSPSYPGQTPPHFETVIEGFLYHECYTYEY